jgi:hypothetical protein
VCTEAAAVALVAVSLSATIVIPAVAVAAVVSCLLLDVLYNSMGQYTLHFSTASVRRVPKNHNMHHHVGAVYASSVLPLALMKLHKQNVLQALSHTRAV